MRTPVDVPPGEAGRWQQVILRNDRWEDAILAIEREASAQPAPPLDVERLIADMQALEPPASVRRETLRGWHDALAEASHLLRARLGSAPSRSES